MSTNPLNDISKVYLEQVFVGEEKKEKPARWWDDDGDGKGWEDGEVSGKFKKKKKKVKENYSYSNWRQDLAEVMSDTEKDVKVKEKKVNNKININPKLDLGEAVENLGGTLLEMVEVDEVDYIVESVYDELLEEGYGEDDIEEALEYALTEAKVTYGHDTNEPGQKKRGNLVAAVGRLARQKLSSKLRGAKKAAKQAVSTGARRVAKGALGVARKMEGGDKTPSSAHTKSRTASTYRGAGVGKKERVSSGSYTPPSKSKKKAEKPSDPWKGSETVPQKPKPKAQTTRPSDPWRGSETVPPKAKAAAPKAKTKKEAAPKTKTTAKKKKSSKLDDLLSSIRSESVQIEEKTLTKMEMKKREELVKSMKKKSADFENRYPGRGKEVMYATATKMAKRMAEQALDSQVKTQEPKEKPLNTSGERQQYSNLKMMQQKQQQLQKQELNLKKQGKLPLGTH